MMRVELHPKAISDILQIMEYYEQVATAELAEEFYQELSRCVRKTSERPGLYKVHRGGLRRVNLHRFPYHLLFREVDDSIRVLVIRHHRRHPSFGRRRN